MAKKTIGRNINTSDTAKLSAAVALNASTSTKIADAYATRIFFAITNNSNKDIFLKLQVATLDNVSNGIVVYRKSYWEMPVDNIYTGEVSAISDTGTPDVFVTEY